MLSNGRRTRVVANTTARRTQSVVRGTMAVLGCFFLVRAAMTGRIRFGEARSSAFRLLRGERLQHLLDRCPIPVRRGDAQLFLELAEITDRFHFAAIEAEDESPLDGDDLCEPVVVGRQTKRECRPFPQ